MGKLEDRDGSKLIHWNTRNAATDIPQNHIKTQGTGTQHTPRGIQAVREGSREKMTIEL